MSHLLSNSGRITDKRPRLRSILGLVCAVVVAGLLADRPAAAQSPYGYGFQPFGFYQPYGVQYRSTVPTPPYFAVNPPVYYGTRHFRPYGISPFAAPPQVGAPSNYHGERGASSLRQKGYGGPVGNPFICHSAAKPDAAKQAATLASNKPITVGRVQSNPFVSEELHLAQGQIRSTK